MYCDLWPYVLWPLDLQMQKRIVSAETIWGNTVYSVWKLLLNDSKWNLEWKSWKLWLCTGLLFLLFSWLSIIFGVTYFWQKKLLLGIARKCPHFFSQSQIKLSFSTKYLYNLSTLYPQISQNKKLNLLNVCIIRKIVNIFLFYDKSWATKLGASSK